MSSRPWVRIPPALPRADAEHRRAQRAVTASPRLWWFDSTRPHLRVVRPWRGGTVNRYEHETIWASLDEIRIGERTVARLSTATVELVPRVARAGSRGTAGATRTPGDAFVVRDGRHRVAAALAAGHTVIEAEVRPIGRIRVVDRSWIASRSSGGSARAARSHLGTRSGSASRLHRAGRGFDSHRLHPGLRSVNGKHAPFVRPRCGFDSCRRLSQRS